MLVSASPPLHSRSTQSAYFAQPVASPSTSFADLSLASPPVSKGAEYKSRPEGPTPVGPNGQEVVEPAVARTLTRKPSRKGKEKEEMVVTVPDRPQTPQGMKKDVGLDDLPDIPLSPDHLPPAFPSGLKKHGMPPDIDETVDAEGRPRFVGNPDIRRDADEPILQENKRRFVLFPIQYHEVCCRRSSYGRAGR